MNHLKSSFFISTNKIEIEAPNYKYLKFDSYFFGHFSDRQCIIEFKPMVISLDGFSFSSTVKNNENTAIIDEDTLEITGSDMNTQAIYYIYIQESNYFVVFNDLFLARFILQSLNLPIVYDIKLYSENLTFFQNINRLLFGEKLIIRKRNNKLLFEKRNVSNILLQSSNNVSFEIIKENFYNELNKSVKELTKEDESVNISLSGGIDSGTIAYILKHSNKNVNAYTLSTDWGDEYIKAKETADFLKINLIKIHITKEEIISEVPNVIRYFTFTNPESIEIALIAFCLYKKLNEQNKIRRTFVTGYGSDLINAGIFSPFTNYNDLRTEILLGLRKTQVSNEFSNLSALSFDVNVKHPYWRTNIIKESLKIPVEYKVVDNKDKYFFRKMMEARLPKEIAWRKKIGAHHGTGLSAYLKKEFEVLGMQNSYQLAIMDFHKNIFCNGNY